MNKYILIVVLLFISVLFCSCENDVVCCTKEVLTIESKTEATVTISGDKFTMEVNDKHLLGMNIGTTFSAIVMRKYDKDYNPKEITVINDISQ